MRENTLVIIPARAGSKGLKGKNKKIIQGLPLVEHSIRFATEHFDPKNIVVSTDDPYILKLTRVYEIASKELRPDKLSGPTAKTIDVVKFELEQFNGAEIDTVLLLQPTSPLRKHSDIPAIQKLLESGKTKSVVSVSKVDEPHPYKMLRKDLSGNLVPLIENCTDTPRQCLPKCYQLAGMYYWISVKTLLEAKSFLPLDSLPFEIPSERAVNINNILDFYLCERLFQDHEF